MNTKILNITEIKKLKNSYVGNPQYLLITDFWWEYKTKANAGYSYQLSTNSRGKYKITYHLTKTNRFVIDTLEPLEEK